MQTKFKVSDNLALELWPGARGDPSDRALLKLVALDQMCDNPDAGQVVIYLNEVRALIEVLGTAACDLVNAVVDD